MTEKSRVVLIISVALIAFAVLGTAYYCFDPADTVWMPRCLWKTLTGTDCPGCGSQRMVHALLHGDVRSAWNANPFVLCSLPLIVFMLWIEAGRSAHPRLYAALHRPLAIYLLLSAVLLWWILRNF